jgi:hypothetical protein
MPEKYTPGQEQPNQTSTSKESLYKWADRLYTPIFALITGGSGVQTGLRAAHGDEAGAAAYAIGTIGSAAALILRDTAMRLSRDGLQNQVNHLREQVNNYRDLLNRGKK